MCIYWAIIISHTQSLHKADTEPTRRLTNILGFVEHAKVVWGCPSTRLGVFRGFVREVSDI